MIKSSCKSIQKILDEKLKNDTKIFIIGDIHGFHKNITLGTSNWNEKTACRKFDNEILMTERVVNNINAAVSEDDILISGGDWCFGNISNYSKLRDMILCKNIIHIYGNHDEKIRENEYLQNMFLWVGDYFEIRVDKTLIVFCHYPIYSWNEMNKGSCMVHFHCHGSIDRDLGRIIDCGVDTNDMKPYDLSDVVDRLMAKPLIEGRDHHL